MVGLPALRVLAVRVGRMPPPQTREARDVPPDLPRLDRLVDDLAARRARAS